MNVYVIYYFYKLYFLSFLSIISLLLWTIIYYIVCMHYYIQNMFHFLFAILTLTFFYLIKLEKKAHFLSYRVFLVCFVFFSINLIVLFFLLHLIRKWISHLLFCFANNISFFLFKFSLYKHFFLNEKINYTDKRNKNSTNSKIWIWLIEIRLKYHHLKNFLKDFLKTKNQKVDLVKLRKRQSLLVLI